MTKQPYPEEFKTEVVKQISERGRKVADVSTRNVLTHVPHSIKIDWRTS